MNKEHFNKSLETIIPGELSSMDTAQATVSLLRQTYTQHALTNNIEGLADSIQKGDVLTWIVKDSDELVATTSLIKTGDVWEGGRSVCVLPGRGIGGHLMRTRTKFHFDHHQGQSLVGEVRVADEFEGIPSGQATQKIWFDELKILPHALAPLFEHGKPMRKEVFGLVSSDKSRKIPISEEIHNTINNRSKEGEISLLKINKEGPFNQIQPSPNGKDAKNVISQAVSEQKTSLFIVEATDQNMPLIGQLITNQDVMVCGVDRSVGKNGLPVILFTTFKKGSLIAPTKISSLVPNKIRKDMQHIADQFTLRGKQ